MSTDSPAATGRRVLALDDDRVFLKMLDGMLTPLGIIFRGIHEPTRAVPEAKAFAPDLFLIDRHMPILSGGEVLRSLRAFPECAGIPVAFATADTTEAEVVRALKSGAIDVIHKLYQPDWRQRIIGLLDEVTSQQGSMAVGGPSLATQRVLAFHRRIHREGVLRLNPDTPFEGRAVFKGGELIEAELGPAQGITAIEEMLSFENGVWAFDAGEAPAVVVPAPGPAAPPAHLSILFVDDDPDIRQLYQIQLHRSGFQVEVAEDGAVACELAVTQQFDVVLADLNMPRLDGWGMLRRLQADHRTRDLPVIFLSAHDDYRETLKAAKAGAFDYLAKTGRSEEVIDRVRAALEPRSRAIVEIKGGNATLRLSALAPQWVLRRLGRLRATGILTAKDGWGEYSLSVRDGQPIEAYTRSAQRTATGVAAVAALLVSRDATATFKAGPVPGPGALAADMDGLLLRTAETLNHLEARITAGKLSQATVFDVDEELYALFQKVGSDRDQLLARAVCEQRVAPAELPKQVSLSAAEIEEGLKELLRRGVISFRGEA